MKLPTAPCAACAILISACGGGNTGSSITAPGGQETVKTKALETGANLMQRKTPLGDLNAYLDGFHFANGDIESQVEAHHYCGHVNQDVIQCVIYDGNEGGAKLIGVEYIVSKSLFESLPREEKHLWHSHVYEVHSGQLIAPGIPDAAEHELMKQLVNTYGKTWHLWHTDQKQSLPLGIPTLMMGFTKDGQAKQAMVDDRDKRFNVSSAKNRDHRSDIDRPDIDPEADAWQKGIAVQLQASTQNSAAARHARR